jgi:hypothetical protein
MFDANQTLRGKKRKKMNETMSCYLDERTEGHNHPDGYKQMYANGKQLR